MNSSYSTSLRLIGLINLLFLLNWSCAHAQIRVGAPINQPINPGASLEIQAGPYPDNGFRGLLLPRVALSSYTQWTLAGTPTDGMLIFNTATSSGNYAVSPGVYVWSNFQWNRLVQPPSPAIITAVDCLTNSPATGLYYTNRALSTDNVKQVLLTPGSAGAYNASTNTSNNIRFSASGNFTASQVGIPQLITLQGSGMPLGGGSFVFTLMAETQTCSFVVNAQAYVDCTGPLGGTYKVNQALDASNTKQITIIPQAAGDYRFLSIVYTPDIMNYFTFTKNVTITADQVGQPQTIILEASGTPHVAGNFNAVVQVSADGGKNYTVGCNFSILVSP